MTLEQLKRVRWGVRGVLALGVAASTLANVLHANPNVISRAIAAWPPLALLLTVELISRVPIHRRSLAAVRLLATAVIAGIAAWVSYWHMVGVAARYGETGASPYLIPISVDGLIVVASICLVEIGAKITSEQVIDPVSEPIMTGPVFDHAEPIGPMPAPRRPAVRKPPAAGKVAAAHAKEPAASNARIAQLARVSESSVKRYRPLALAATAAGSGQ